MRPTCRYAVRAIAVLLAITWLSAAFSHAQQGAPKPAGSEPTYLFEMRGKPWAQIFEWLTDTTGLPFISNYPAPTGTIHVIVKQGRRYTLGELLDLLNDALLPSKYVIVRRSASFTLAPADEKLPRQLAPRIALEDVAGRGNSEIVEIMLPLKGLVADDYAPQVKKMMGPFGEVQSLRQGNRLILQDTAGNLRLIIATTREIEADLRPAAIVAEVVPLVQLDAAKAAETFRAMHPLSKTGAPFIEADPSRNAILLKGTAEQIRDVKQTIRILDGAADQLRVFVLPYGSGAMLADVLERVLPKFLNNPIRVVTPTGSR